MLWIENDLFIEFDCEILLEFNVVSHKLRQSSMYELEFMLIDGVTL